MLSIMKPPSNLPPVLRALSAALFMAAGILVVSFFNYALYHTTVELFSVVVAFGVFMITWSARRVMDNGYFLFLGIAYLFVGVLDLCHAVAHPGISAFASDDLNIAVQLWIGARALEALSLLTAPMALRRQLKPSVLFLVYATVCTFLLASIFHWDLFPVCFDAPGGATPFKRLTEYGLVAVLLAALFPLYRMRAHFERGVLYQLSAYLLVTAGANAYGYDLFSIGAHFIKVIAFYLIYRAIIKTGLVRPFDLLFRDLKQSEATLRIERDRAQRYLDIAGVLIVVVDADQKVSLINRRGCEILGLPEDAILGKNWFDHFIPQGARAEAKANFVKLQLMGGKRPLFEYAEGPLLQRGGGERIIAWHNTLLDDPTGRILGVLSSGEDITLRKEAEARLVRHGEELEALVEDRTRELKTANEQLLGEISERQESERRLKESERKFWALSQEFHTLLNAIPDALLLLSPELRILWANDSASRVFQRHLTDMNGRHCFDLWERPAEICQDCVAVQCFKSGRSTDARFTATDGRSWEIGAFPIGDEQGKVVKTIVIYRDVTEKTRLQAEALRAAHLASLGELSAGLAHEINNPTNGIINYAQILASRNQPESKEHDIARRIQKEGERMARIVKSLLSFARPRKEQKVPVSIHEILSDCLALTAALFRQDGIRLKTDLPSDLPLIIANPQQIQQVFLNIINNAHYALNQKFPGISGEKILEITGRKIHDREQQTLRIMFHDRGTGVPADLVNKVMNPFFTTKPNNRGTGLGLSISHGIISDHNGRIRVESREGEFTRVIVDLPACQTEREEKAGESLSGVSP
jgi:PAS domain S-box-containing protein